jgi:hypothetical protein
MDLLNYFFINIFYHLDYPKTVDICGNTGQIENYCYYVINTTKAVSLLLLLGIIFVAARATAIMKYLAFFIFSFPSLYFLADSIMIQLSKPDSYGIDWFIITFNLWTWLFINIYLLSLIFWGWRVKFLYLNFFVTIVFTYLFIITGRGTIEHAFTLIGETMFDVNLITILQSSVVYIIGAIFLLTIIYGLLAVAGYWIKTGLLEGKIFFRNFKVFLTSILIIFLIYISYPFGLMLNKLDVKEAKSFINEISKFTQKYYYENGEYPMEIGSYLENKSSETPWILKRNEYFSHGIKGTYYLSRPQKYCFIFQNPGSTPGYYTLTSMRGWRHNASVEAIEDVFVRYCDEVGESHENLISQHIGLTGPDDFIGRMANEFNIPYIPATSKKASRKLHEKITEFGEENPEIYRYYRDPDRNSTGRLIDK